MPEKEKLILMLVIVFTISIAVMVVFFFILINKFRISLDKRQKVALNNLIIGQDNERERLARDLHDQMGPQLSAIHLIIDEVKTHDRETADLIVEIKTELKNAIQEIRHISHDLKSQSLVRYGLLEALKEMSKRQERSGITIGINANIENLMLSERQSAHIYKIAQELIYNSIKHGQAKNADIELHSNQSKNEFKLIYQDNGKGNPDFDPDKAGIGLKNIQTRVRLMNGEIEFDMNKGFRCELKMPLKDE